MTTRIVQSAVKFKPYKDSDDIEDYFKRLEMSFAVTGVKVKKQVAHLPTELGTQISATLKSFAVPKAPKDCTMDKIKENSNHPSLQSVSLFISETSFPENLSMDLFFNCDWIYGNRSKSHIGSYEMIDFKDFNTL